MVDRRTETSDSLTEQIKTNKDQKKKLINNIHRVNKFVHS